MVQDLCYVLGWRYLTKPVTDPIDMPYKREVLNKMESTKSFRITKMKEKLLFVEVNDDLKYTCRLPNDVEIQ